MGKSIFKFHPLWILTAFICLFLGYFRFFITLSLLILFHECGHIVMMLIFNWNIKYVMLLPFGGMTICEDFINRPLYQEFLVALMGPVFQVIYAFLFKSDLVLAIHYPLLIFNLLPIYPLDGMKIFSVFLNKLFPYYQTLKLSFFISLLTIFISFLISNNTLWFLIIFFLLKENIKTISKKDLIFNKFLYERANYDFKFKKVKIINDVKKMKRDVYHFFTPQELSIQPESIYLKHQGYG